MPMRRRTSKACPHDTVLRGWAAFSRPSAPFHRTREMRRFAAWELRPCRGAGGMPGFAGRGCTPHFLFETSKRKCAVHGGKEKMFGRLNLTQPCQVDRKTGVSVAGAYVT